MPATACVVQVQHPFPLTGLARPRQRAGFTRLITRHRKVVRHLITGAPHHAALGTELTAVGGIRRENAVLRIKQDVRLGQALQVGHHFWQGFRNRVIHGVQCRLPLPECVPNVRSELPILAVCGNFPHTRLQAWHPSH